jgi:hypothetical protein
MKYHIILLVFILSIGGVLAGNACSDSNQVDISDIPCVGLTNIVECTGNVSVIDTNTTIQTNVTTYDNGDGRLNFTFNFSIGSYSLVDCSNNSATVIVGVFEQGYGINIFIIILPAIILSFTSLFFSWRFFESLKKSDEETLEIMENEEDHEDFVPNTRLIPVVFMLFSFIPLIFMTGFVSNNLTQYINVARITDFYSNFYIYFSWMFYLIAILSFVVWAAGFIKKIRINRGAEYD